MDLPPGYTLIPNLFDLEISDPKGTIKVYAPSDQVDRAVRFAWLDWHRAFGKFKRPVQDLRPGGSFTASWDQVFPGEISQL